MVSMTLWSSNGVNMFRRADGQATMHSYPISSSSLFDPDAVVALTDAYEHACAALGLADRLDPLTEMIAKKVIERAQAGELDAVRLCEVVLEELRAKG
jgi:hypothetical protein